MGIEIADVMDLEAVPDFVLQRTAGRRDDGKMTSHWLYLNPTHSSERKGRPVVCLRPRNPTKCGLDLLLCPFFEVQYPQPDSTEHRA